MTYPQLEEMLRADIRYGIYSKRKRGGTHVVKIARTGSEDARREMEELGAAMKRSAKIQEIDLGELHVGLVQIRVLSPARVARHAKFKQWIEAP